MEIDLNKIVTQEETGELAPIDEVEARVEAEMKLIEGRAKESVAQGMDDPEREDEGRAMQEEAARTLEAERARADEGQQST